MEKLRDPIEKWAKELKRRFLVEEIKMIRQYFKKCTTALPVRELQIKTSLKFISCLSE